MINKINPITQANKIAKTRMEMVKTIILLDMSQAYSTTTPTKVRQVTINHLQLIKFPPKKKALLRVHLVALKNGKTMFLG